MSRFGVYDTQRNYSTSPAAASELRGATRKTPDAETSGVRAFKPSEHPPLPLRVVSSPTRCAISSGMSDTKPDEYSPAEIAERMGRALERALDMPHQTQKPKPKKRGRPRKRVLKPRRTPSSRA